MFNLFVFALLNIIFISNCDKDWLIPFTNPEVFMNVSEIIQFNGYPCENHAVITSDGYILSIQRIPYGRKNSTKKRPIVFLQHGLVDSSFTWVNNGPNKSLGFILADNEFDVWLANSRGNVYSDKHRKFSRNSNEFWDFTWDEMVKYDLSASIEYILSFTNSENLSYIGHSQGTEIIFAKLSQNSSLNKKILSVVALAPVAYLGNVKSGIRYLAHVVGGIDFLIQLFNHGEFLPSDNFTKSLAEYVCGKKLPIVCSNLLFLLAGYDISNLNYGRLAIYLAHTPAGTSSKNMVHYAQSYESDEFQMYDYGFIGNLFHYFQLRPPKYDFDTHGVPLAFFSGGNDWLASNEDVVRTMKKFGSSVKYNRFIPYYNHLDFVWGENAAQIIYPDIIRFIKQYIS